MSERIFATTVSNCWIRLSRQLYQGSVLLAGLAMLGILSASAPGFDIVVQYDANQSDTYIDPDGVDRTSELTAVMLAAASHWKDLIQDDHTLTLTFWWEDTGPNAGIADHGNLKLKDGREISADIRFATMDYSVDPNNPTPMPWWLDPSPLSDTEFNMTQTLYRDLSPIDQVDFFNGSPPETFEAGYQGSTNASAPMEAMERLDLLSSALHEIGHALGLTDDVSGSETIDNDYDIDPGFVRGAVMAVETQSPSDRGHLKSPTDLMTASGTTGVRRRPAAADILSLAAGSGWTDIDLPRQDFLGGSSWNDGVNWLGGTVPDVADEAYIRPQAAPSIVHLTTDASAAKVLVGDGSFLSTNANLLKIGGATIIQDAGSQIFVNKGGTLRTNRLQIIEGGELDMTGGLTDVNDTLFLGPGSKITGNGTIEVGAGLTNAGLIRPDDGTMTFTTTGSSVWNLDGFLTVGNIDCSVGDLTVDGTLTDSFGGTATVGQGHTLTFIDGWSLGTLGTLNLNGTSAAANVVGPSEIVGDITVNGTGQLFVEQTFRPTSAVQIPLAGDTLALSGSTTFDGFTVTGSGVLQQFSDVTVISNTTINTTTYDWGNSSAFQRNDTTINAGVTLTINSNTTGTPENRYRGVIQVNSGILQVNTDDPWTLPSPFGALIPQGTLNLVNNGGGTPIVRGAPLVVSGNIDVSLGIADVQSELQTTTSANITVNSGADLQLSGTTTFDGGTVSGPGAITQQGDIEIVGDTTIGTDVFAWGNSSDLFGVNSLTLHPETTLTIGSSSTGTASNDFRGNLVVDSATLIVGASSSWTLPTNSALFPLPSPGKLIFAKSTATTPTVFGARGLFVAGAIEMQGASGQLATATTLLPGGTIHYAVDSQLQLVNTFILAGGTLDHAANDGLISSSPAAAWAYEPGAAIQIVGTVDGSLTLDLAAGTTVFVEDLAPATMTIAPGASLIVAGVTDPFTSTSNPATSINIVNDSVSSLTIQVPSRVGKLSGVGKTIVDSDFSAAEVSQDIFAVDQFARFLLYQPNSSITTTTQFKNVGTVAVAGDVDVWGPTINTGTIQLPFVSTAVFHGPLTHNKGELIIPSTSTLSLEGPVVGDGTFKGPGLVRFGDRFDPGSPISEVAVQGDVQFQDAATLGIEIGGTTPGSKFDFLRVNGAATLSGTLEVVLADLGGGLFSPSPGDDFTILGAAAGLTGTFVNEVLPPATGDVVLRVQYASNTVTLIANYTADFDLDGDVDGDDLVEWESSFGINNGADADGDGDSDGVDFLKWQQQFGLGIPLQTENIAVPEPSTWIALLCGLTIFLSKRVVPAWY